MMDDKISVAVKAEMDCCQMRGKRMELSKVSLRNGAQAIAGCGLLFLVLALCPPFHAHAADAKPPAPAVPAESPKKDEKKTDAAADEAAAKKGFDAD